MAIGDLASKGYVQNFVSSLIKKLIDGGKLGGKHKYSTEEQVVGEWIDGKPIYEKTFVGTATSTNTTQAKCDYIGTSSEINVINIVSSGLTKTNNFYISEFFIGCFVNVVDGFIYLRQNVTSASQSFDYKVTIQYTKTTD